MENNNPKVVAEEKNPMAIAGLVLGIVSVVTSFLLVYVGLVTGIVGIILSAKGRKIPAKKGMATAGLICSIIGTALGGVLLACALCVVGTINEAISNMN